MIREQLGGRVLLDVPNPQLLPSAIAREITASD